MWMYLHIHSCEVIGYALVEPSVNKKLVDEILREIRIKMRRVTFSFTEYFFYRENKHRN